MNIATKLDQDYAAKLTYIQSQTQQDVHEIVQQAIDLYYQQLKPLQKSPFEVLKEAGLVGCFEGSPDLSANHKTIVQEFIEQKHSPNLV